MPPDSRLEFVQKGKQLRIIFKDALSRNTTYTLTSNGAIKDITEGNDSLMTWTFSTGPILDSLKIVAFGQECLPNTKTKNMFFGLYLNDTIKTPRYIGRFEQNGQVLINGLKEGSYFAKAFIDEDQNGICSIAESQDQYFNPVIIEANKLDTLHFRLSKPKINSDSTNLLQTQKPIFNDSIENSATLSTIIINLDKIEQSLILELYDGEKLCRQEPVLNSQITIDKLKAGNYTLRLVFDKNNNQQWDAIDLVEKTRAENLIYYPEKIKLRANWELTIDMNISGYNLFNN